MLKLRVFYFLSASLLWITIKENMIKQKSGQIHQIIMKVPSRQSLDINLSLNLKIWKNYKVRGECTRWSHVLFSLRNSPVHGVEIISNIIKDLKIRRQWFYNTETKSGVAFLGNRRKKNALPSSKILGPFLGQIYADPNS